MLTVHDWISGRAARVDMLEGIMRTLVDDATVWVASCGQIAAHHETQTNGMDVTLNTIIPVNKRKADNG